MCMDFYAAEGGWGYRMINILSILLIDVSC